MPTSYAYLSLLTTHYRFFWMKRTHLFTHCDTKVKSSVDLSLEKGMNELEFNFFFLKQWTFSTTCLSAVCWVELCCPTSKLKASAEPLCDYIHICFFKSDCCKMQPEASESFVVFVFYHLLLVNMLPFMWRKTKPFLRVWNEAGSGSKVIF